MAKIGNLSEWIPKDFSDPSSSRETQISKYIQRQKALEVEISKLKQEIQVKNSKINQMSTEYEPEKASLLEKISLLCEKLHNESNTNFELWIEEIELARLKARYNESTIAKLEGKLQSHKEKIIDLESKLRVLGIDPEASHISPFNFNEYLKNLFKITEKINFLLEKSEKNLRIIDSVLGNQDRFQEFSKKKSERKEKNLKIYEKTETCEAINSKITEIKESLENLDFFQSELSGSLEYLQEREVKDIEKTLQKTLEVVQNFKRTLENCSEPLSKRSTLWNQRQDLSKEVRSFKDMHSKLQQLEKETREFVLREEFKSSLELQEVLRMVIETSKLSEERLVEFGRICNKDFLSLQDERDVILQKECRNVQDDLEMIKRLLILINKQEMKKQEILEPFKNFKKIESEVLLVCCEKISIEKHFFSQIRPEYDFNGFDVRPRNFEEVLNLEKNVLDLLRDSLEFNCFRVLGC
jgi:hypothetical protein